MIFSLNAAKGGVGKTTSAVNLREALSSAGTPLDYDLSSPTAPGSLDLTAQAEAVKAHSDVYDLVILDPPEPRLLKHDAEELGEAVRRLWSTNWNVQRAERKSFR